MDFSWTTKQVSSFEPIIKKSNQASEDCPRQNLLWKIAWRICMTKNFFFEPKVIDIFMIMIYDSKSRIIMINNCIYVSFHPLVFFSNNWFHGYEFLGRISNFSFECESRNNPALYLFLKEPKCKISFGLSSMYLSVEIARWENYKMIQHKHEITF